MLRLLSFLFPAFCPSWWSPKPARGCPFSHHGVVLRYPDCCCFTIDRNLTFTDLFVLSTEGKTPLLGRRAAILSSPLLGVPFSSLTLQVRLFFFPVPLAVDCAVPSEGGCFSPLFPRCRFPKPSVGFSLAIGPRRGRGGAKSRDFRWLRLAASSSSFPRVNGCTELPLRAEVI